MEDYVDVNKNSHNDIAHEYVERHKTRGINEPNYDEYWNLIMKHVDYNTNLKVLELGPGQGLMLKYMEEQKVRTMAIELSDKMLELAKKESPNTFYIDDDIRNVNLHNNQFDIIFAGSFVHLFQKDDLNLVMNKICSWLKKDGALFFYTTIHEKDEEDFFEKSDYKSSVKRYRRKFTKDSFEKLLLDHNLETLEFFTREEPERNKNWQFYLCRKYANK